MSLVYLYEFVFSLQYLKLFDVYRRHLLPALLFILEIHNAFLGARLNAIDVVVVVTYFICVLGTGLFVSSG